MLCCNVYGNPLAKAGVVRRGTASRTCGSYAVPRTARASRRGLSVLALDGAPRTDLGEGAQRTRRELCGAVALVGFLPVQQVLAASQQQNALKSSCEDLKDGPDGIKFCDVVAGTGLEPFEGDVVKTNYEARIAESGLVVDSGKFFLFGLGNGEVIKGWDVGILGGEGMPSMAVGGTRRLVVPARLAYGSSGAGCTKDGKCEIPPETTLEFTIQLINIQ